MLGFERQWYCLSWLSQSFLLPPDVCIGAISYFWNSAAQRSRYTKNNYNFKQTGFFDTVYVKVKKSSIVSRFCSLQKWVDFVLRKNWWEKLWNRCSSDLYEAIHYCFQIRKQLGSVKHTKKSFLWLFLVRELVLAFICDIKTYLENCNKQKQAHLRPNCLIVTFKLNCKNCVGCFLWITLAVYNFPVKWFTMYWFPYDGHNSLSEIKLKF